MAVVWRLAACEQGSNCYAECLPLPHVTPQSQVSFQFLHFPCSFLKSLLAIPWLLLNPTDPYSKQTLSLLISRFGVKDLSLTSGSFGCPVFTCCFHSPFMQWVTLQDRFIRRFVTLKLNWYKNYYYKILWFWQVRSFVRVEETPGGLSLTMETSLVTPTSLLVCPAWGTGSVTPIGGHLTVKMPGKYSHCMRLC